MKVISRSIALGRANHTSHRRCPHDFTFSCKVSALDFLHPKGARRFGSYRAGLADYRSRAYLSDSIGE